MSATVRGLLAAAASTGLGVPKAVAPYYRQSTAPGFGWVSLARTDRDDSGFDDYLDTWQIRIVLAQEIRKAEAWIDEHVDTLVAAVRTEMVVTNWTPARLDLDAKTTVNALIIEGVREH